MPYKFGDKKVYWLGERGSGFKPKSLDGVQSFTKIRDKCKRDLVKFEDDEFPANDDSIGTFEGNDEGPYTWRRPKEICKHPKFFVDGTDRFDAEQGVLGNCWFIAAVADLTLNKENLNMVVPDDNTLDPKSYTGAFHFRFWQFGKWIEVVVDDRLPCTPDGKLAFMHSKSQNEFWSALLEKAYAKLKGSYGVLNGGITVEALEDFTGGFTEIFFIDKLESMTKDDRKMFYDILKHAFKRNTFLGANLKKHPEITEAELPNGLVCGHAYSITNLREVTMTGKDGERRPVRLLRLRNPWGSSSEWNGNFSDSSGSWNRISACEKKAMEVEVKADGEFWMSYRDFLENFERVEFCHLNPLSEEELIAEETESEQKAKAKQWIKYSKHGNWSFGVTAGGSYRYKETFGNNPQYILDIGEPGEQKNTFIVCLLKKDKQVVDVEEDQDIENVENVAVSVFKLWEDSPKPLDMEFFKYASNKPLAQGKPKKGLREITLRFEEPSGRYCIIPSSVKPDQEGEFLLRVFTEGRSTLELYDVDVSIQEDEVEVKDDTPEEKAQLESHKKFFKLVAGNDDEVNWWELKLILDKTFHDEFQYEGFGFSEDVCRSLVALMDEDRSGKLGFVEFTNLWKQITSWKDIFNKFDTDQSRTLGSLKTHELRGALKAGGYAVNKDILEDIVLRYGDRTGEVALDKFIIAALKVKTMIELFKRHEVPGKGTANVTLLEWLDETLYS